MLGNTIAGFSIGGVSTGLTAYYLANNQAAMEYLALHEVAHDSAAGITMNNNTPNKNFNDFSPGTTNWADENFANTVALATMQVLGLSLGRYDPTSATGTLNLNGGWQTNKIWTLNHE